MKRLPGERLVGLFLLGAAGAVLALGVAVASRKQLLEERHLFSTHFHRGHGLAKGSSVYMIDIQAGRVRSIAPQLGPDGTPYVGVEFEIRDSFLKYIKSDSVASVSATTVAGEFLGGKVLEVSVGSPNSTEAPPGMLLLSLDSEEGQALLGRSSMESLPADVEGLIHHASELLASLNDPDSSLRHTLSALENLDTAELPAAAQKVGQLLDDMSQPGALRDTLDEVLGLLDKLSDPKSSLGHLMIDEADLYQGIATSMDALNRASQQAESAFGALNNQTVPEMSVSMKEMKTSMEDMQQVMNELSVTIVDLNRVLSQAESVLGSVEQTRFVKKRGDEENEDGSD